METWYYICSRVEEWGGGSDLRVSLLKHIISPFIFIGRTCTAAIQTVSHQWALWNNLWHPDQPQDQWLGPRLEGFHCKLVISWSEWTHWPGATHLVCEGLITGQDLRSAAVRTLEEPDFTPQGVFMAWEIPISEGRSTCLHVWFYRSNKINSQVKLEPKRWTYFVVYSINSSLHSVTQKENSPAW